MSWVVLALVHKNSSVVGPTAGSIEDGAGASEADAYVSIGGAGALGRCITELKRRCVRTCVRACVCVFVHMPCAHTCACMRMCTCLLCRQHMCLFVQMQSMHSP